jgi:hypothetical protein
MNFAQESIMAARRLCPVSHVNFEPAGEGDRALGLLGWCRFRVFDAYELSAMLRRRRVDQQIHLAHKRSTSRRGRHHSDCAPVTDEIAKAVLLQVLYVLRDGIGLGDDPNADTPQT